MGIETCKRGSKGHVFWSLGTAQHQTACATDSRRKILFVVVVFVVNRCSVVRVTES